MKIKLRTDSVKSKRILDETLPNVDIVKYATVQFDGKQFMIKIPKEIAAFYNMKKGDSIKLAVRIGEADTPSKNEFEVLHEK